MGFIGQHIFLKLGEKYVLKKLLLYLLIRSFTFNRMKTLKLDEDDNGKFVCVSLEHDIRS